MCGKCWWYGSSFQGPTSNHKPDYPCASHGRAILSAVFLSENFGMQAGTGKKDTMKLEKVSLLILTVCIVVLLSIIVFKPF